MDSSIIDRIVVVWLGGHAHSWQNTAEFNMVQDFIGSRVLFDSGVALVQLPCLGVVDHFTISRAEAIWYQPLISKAIRVMIFFMMVTINMRLISHGL